MGDFSPVQWYPGHMAKAKKTIKNNLNLVDLSIEVVDARIPRSSRNPDLEEILAKKPRVIALNKKDLADGAETKKWLAYFRSCGLGAVAVNGALKQGIKELITVVRTSAEPLLLALESKGRKRRPVRVMVVGIPNVGKSTLINAIVDQGAAKTGNKPGITKGPQWVRIGAGLEVLDMPGLLWPKFENPETGFRLAATGAISDLVFPLEEVARDLVRYLRETDPEALRARYKIEGADPDPEKTLELIGRKRGLLASGGGVKMEQAAALLLQEFRNGKLGRFTLEKPVDN